MYYQLNNVYEAKCFLIWLELGHLIQTPHNAEVWCMRYLSLSLLLILHFAIWVWARMESMASFNQTWSVQTSKSAAQTVPLSVTHSIKTAQTVTSPVTHCESGSLWAAKRTNSIDFLCKTGEFAHRWSLFELTWWAQIMTKPLLSCDRYSWRNSGLWPCHTFHPEVRVKWKTVLSR